MIETSHLTDLYPYERRVLSLISQGKRNPEIALALGLTTESTRTYVWKIKRKLGALTRYDLMDLSEKDKAVLREAKRAKDKGLSRRDIETLQLLAQGRNNKEIGYALGSTASAISKRITDIKAKLGIWSRVSLGIYAVKEGIVSLEENGEMT